jgi:hypothetical protein
MNSKRLDSLLRTIERNLSDWIPMGVKELDVQSPAYCLFVWYQDYCSDFTPHIGVATQKLLDSIDGKKFDDPVDRFDMIWRPQQVADIDAPDRLLLDECDIVENEVEDCYDLLAESSGLFNDELDDSDEDETDDESDAMDGNSDTSKGAKSDQELSDQELEDELDEEFKALAPFREMLYRVGDQLRKVDWKTIMPIRENFVVVVCDYNGNWLSEDFQRGVDEELFKKLLEQKMLMQPDEVS